MTTTIRYIGAAAIAVALIGSAAIVAGAQEPGPMGPGARMHARGPGGPGGPGGGLAGGALAGLRALDLTDAQQAQVKTIMDGNKAAFQEIGTRMRSAHEALRKAIEATPVNEEAIRTASAGVAAVEADAAVLRANVRAQVHGILSAEQLQKAAELKARREARLKDRAERRQERGSRRGPGPNGPPPAADRF
ncbi:MAG: Spy/CpxP family protein refolding chaperone [Vicinamibacterales bacterium]